MSEDESKRVTAQDEQTDEVEAHRASAKAANDEGGNGDGDDDFEAHRASAKNRPGHTG